MSSISCRCNSTPSYKSSTPASTLDYLSSNLTYSFFIKPKHNIIYNFFSTLTWYLQNMLTWPISFLDYFSQFLQHWLLTSSVSILQQYWYFSFFADESFVCRVNQYIVMSCYSFCDYKIISSLRYSEYAMLSIIFRNSRGILVFSLVLTG